MTEPSIPCPAHPQPLTAVRGTVIASSLASLRMHDRYERYLQLLEPSAREEICHGLDGNLCRCTGLLRAG